MSTASLTRFLLRLPAALYERLRGDADAADVSINEYCVRHLSVPITPLAATGAAGRVIAKARDQFGNRLLGLIVHGSWARGEAHVESDVDILVVLARSVPITRALYRTWDAERLDWDGRPVDAHFVHVPAAAPEPGVWCDAAIDGRVLFENGDAVGGALLRVRRAIAEGRLIRREVHGHPYWVEAA